jgi:hypothetical protein
MFFKEGRDYSEADLQRVFFSGVGEIDLWDAKSGRNYLTDAKHMLSFFTWDATPDLAQVAWEWPKDWRPPGPVEVLMRRDGF